MITPEREHRPNDEQVTLLVAEYQNSAELSNHIDSVRNVLTSFFLTLNGALLVLASEVFNGDADSATFGSGDGVLAFALCCLAVLGTLFVAVIARLRRVQLERYTIANSILDTLLGETGPLRRVIALDHETIAESRRGMREISTGSYLWTMIIAIPVAVLVGVLTYLMTYGIHDILSDVAGALLGVAVGGATLFAEHHIYMRLSRPPHEKNPS